MTAAASKNIMVDTAPGRCCLTIRDVAVILPTLNAAKNFETLLPALAIQGISPSQVLVVDSSSGDNTVAIASKFGARVEVIARKDFNHGGTRRLAAELCRNVEILVYITQDAVPDGPGAITAILAAFQNSEVGMAYGRQLPRAGAGPIERHARLHNYPPASSVRSFADRARFGIKTVFCSDSFSAYRRSALESVGSFPHDAYFAEDQIVAGQMLIAGYKLAYVSEACVFHSHGYRLSEEFKRYFDVGVFHARNEWLLNTFGNSEAKGFEFASSELQYLWHEAPWCIPSSLLRTMIKYAGYRVGKLEAGLSTRWKVRLSMQPFYWRQMGEGKGQVFETRT